MLEITRRHILRTSILDFLYCCSILPVLADQAVKVNGPESRHLNWQAFVDVLERISLDRRKTNWNQAATVAQVANIARRLNLGETPIVSQAKPIRSVDKNYPGFQDLLQTIDAQVTLITFAPGQTIPYHDHPDLTGVMTCATGSLEVTEFDLLPAPHGSATIVKHGRRQVLAPGSVSTLTTRSHNVHKVHALKGSHLIDIFIPPYDESRTARTRWFEIDSVPMKGMPDTFLAVPVRTQH